MMAARLIGKAVVVRELMPQDLNRLARHEAAYLDHCRRFALSEAA